MSEDDLAARVDALLEATGLCADARTRADVVHMYAMMRPGVDAMYAVPDARYEAPALIFQAAPKLGEWGAMS